MPADIAIYYFIPETNSTLPKNAAKKRMKGKYGMKNKIKKIQNNFAILVRTALYFILMNNKVREGSTPPPDNS